MASSTVELGLHGFTHGGEAVGRLPDGKACFVAFALPGERVRVAVVEQHQRWCRARLVDVVEPSPDRVEPPCPYFMTCGGCQLQHISAAGQAQLKRRIVTEQLVRVGGISDPRVAETVPAGEDGYRTRARFGVDGQGRLGFRRFHSHEVIPIDRCLLLTGDTQSLREEAGDHWEGMAEVEVRTGSGAGRAVVLRPTATASPTRPARLPRSMPVAMPVAVPGSMPVAVPGSMPVAVPGSMPVAVLDGRGGAVALRGDPTLWERSADRLLRVSATSFSQTNPRAATLLNSLVREAAAVSAGDTALELFAGTGRFTAVLAADGARVTAVEASASAAADLARNFADHPRVRTVRDDAARVAAAWLRQRRRVDVVVLDPPRRGAGTTLCARVARLRPRVIVYASCDPAALARDARALAAAGYLLDRAVPVDQFAQTAAIETVAIARPAGGWDSGPQPRMTKTSHARRP